MLGVGRVQRGVYEASSKHVSPFVMSTQESRIQGMYALHRWTHARATRLHRLFRCKRSNAI